MNPAKRGLNEIETVLEGWNTIRFSESSRSLWRSAREVAALRDALRDPGDTAIVATARIRHLGLPTSDRRIIDSGLVSVIE